MSRTLSLTERGRPTEKRSATLGTKRLGKVKKNRNLPTQKVLVNAGPLVSIYTDDSQNDLGSVPSSFRLQMPPRNIFISNAI